MRELAVSLRKDITAEKLAELIDLSGPSLAGWKRGSQPKKANLEALEKLFVSAGLPQYSARYLDWGPEGAKLPIEQDMERPLERTTRKGKRA